MDKLFEFVKNNKQITIITGGILVLIVLVIFTILPEGTKGGVALIEQPLYFYKSKRISIPVKLAQDMKVNTKPWNIYRIKNDNQNIKVEGIITKLNIDNPSKKVSGGILYEWSNKDGDLVQYDVKTQTMSLVMQNRIEVFPELGVASDSQLMGLLTDFIHKYVDNSYEYKEVNVVKLGNGYKIEGRRLVNGVALQTPGLSKYHDYIELDNQYNLKLARVVLVELESEIADKIKLIKPNELGSVVSRDAYPKEFNQDFPQGLDIDKGKSDDSNQDNLGVEIPKVSNITVESMEVVYLFSNVDQQFLVPVYRLEGKSRVVIAGREFELNSVVHASAIDPDHVYIPSNIPFAP